MSGIIVVDSSGNVITPEHTAGGLAIPTEQQVATVLKHGGSKLGLPGASAIWTAAQLATVQRLQGKTVTLDVQATVFDMVVQHHLKK